MRLPKSFSRSWPQRFFSAAQAQSQYCHVNPWLDGCETRENTVDMMFHVDNGGIVRIVSTGQVVSAGEAINSIQTAGSAIVVGIIIGGGIGAGAAVVAGEGAVTIFLSGIFGGIAGYYGAIATLTTGVVRVMYGATAIMYGGTLMVLGTQGPVGGCGAETDAVNCLIKTK